MCNTFLYQSSTPYQISDTGQGAAHRSTAASNQVSTIRSHNRTRNVQIGDKGVDRRRRDGEEPHDSKVLVHTVWRPSVLCHRFGHHRANFPENPALPTPSAAQTQRHIQRLRRCDAPPHSHDRYGSGAEDSATCWSLLGAEVVPQEGGDPPEHLGELLALLDSEGLGHALLDVSRSLIGAEQQGLTLRRQ